MQKSMSVQSPQTARPESFPKPQNMVGKTKAEIRSRNPTLQKRSGNSERVITHRTALLAVSVLMLLAIPVAGQPQPSRRRLCLWNPFKNWGTNIKTWGKSASRSITKVVAVPFKNIKKCDGCDQRLVFSRIASTKCADRRCSKTFCQKCAGLINKRNKKGIHLRSSKRYSGLNTPRCVKCYKNTLKIIHKKKDEQEQIHEKEIYAQKKKDEKAAQKARDMKHKNSCGGPKSDCPTRLRSNMDYQHCYLCKKLFCHDCVTNKDKFKQAKDFPDGATWDCFGDGRVFAYVGACMPCWQKNEKARRRYIHEENQKTIMQQRRTGG